MSTWKSMIGKALGREPAGVQPFIPSMNRKMRRKLGIVTPAPAKQAEQTEEDPDPDAGLDLLSPDLTTEVLLNRCLAIPAVTRGILTRKYPTAIELGMADRKDLLALPGVGPMALVKIQAALIERNFNPSWAA